MNRNPDTVKEAADRRKQRQRPTKRAGLLMHFREQAFHREKGASGATSSGSQRPAEPAQPPGGKAHSDKGGKGGKSSKGNHKGKGKGQH